ncbi:MAG: efflux RND transporter periplasmic adaptor subunit, partial [Candidatus Buchananbacteria bacterium]
MNQLKKINLIKSISLVVLLATVSISVSGCGKKSTDAETAKPLVNVKGKTVMQSSSSKQQIEYPAIVSSGQEAKLVAKTSGTAKGINFDLGSDVKIGDILIKIDDIGQGASSLGQGFSASQIRQAQLAAEQAETNKRNIAATTAENYKSAQIAYDTSKVAAEQARINLENKKQLFGQNDNDIQTNAITAADSAASLCDTVLTAINNIGGFKVQSSLDIPYKSCLGATDSQSYYVTQNAFYKAENDYQKYQAKFSDTKSQVDAGIKLIKDTSALVDATKKLLEKSITCQTLTATTLGGFQSSVAAFQPQLNTSLSQVNAARQALDS